MILDKGEQGGEEGLLTKAPAVRPAMLSHECIVGVLHHQMRRGPDTLDLTLQDEIQLAAGDLE